MIYTKRSRSKHTTNLKQVDCETGHIQTKAPKKTDLFSAMVHQQKSSCEFIPIMFSGSTSSDSAQLKSEPEYTNEISKITSQAESLVGIDDVQKSLNRSRASVYRYTNTDTRNLNPPFNPRKLNPEYRSDQKDPLLFHPNEVARFAKDILRIKEVTVEVLNSPSTATQQVLISILEELRCIRSHLEGGKDIPSDLMARKDHQDRSAA